VETVRSRLKTFHAETEPLKAFYEKQGVLRLVKGDQDIDLAFAEIMKVIGEA
jgi:adenylate kinase